MRLFIPPLGARIRLSAPWSFVLHRESRNRDVFPLAGWGRQNVHTGSTRIEMRDYSHPNGWKAPAVLGPKLTRTRYDFEEPVIEGTVEALVYPLKADGDWGWDRKDPIGFRIDGTAVVTAPIPEDAMRVVVTAQVRGAQTATVEIPAGSVLKFDRYYIRQGANDFDSVTFRLEKPEGRRKKGDPEPVSGRFWAKLRDVNRIEGELVPELQPWWHGVADRLKAGETLDLAHDVKKVPPRLRVAPLALRTNADLDGTERWLLYAEGSRIGFWLVDLDASRSSLMELPGSAFGTKDQFRGRDLDVRKVVGKVVGIGGAK